MSNLLAKRYKNNKAKLEASVEQGKKLSTKQTVINKQESEKKTVVEHVNIAKEPTTLNLD